VYTLGMWGVLGDVIFKNWKVEDLSGMRDQFTNRRNGLDFGFSSDPAAVGVSHYDAMRKTIYFYKELYETGLTNDILAERVKDMIGDERIICDSAEPKSIQELRNFHVNAVGAKKGKDSVNHGIDWLKRQTIIVDKTCINMQNELSQYHWKKDAGGNSTDVPVDKNNHLIDGGLRYAYEGDMEKGTSINTSAKITNYMRGKDDHR
jgi:phage terminase large subunit